MIYTQHFTVPIGLSIGNHWTSNNKDHAFDVKKTLLEYDTFIPAWYLKEHRVQGITERWLHYPLC